MHSDGLVANQTVVFKQIRLKPGKQRGYLERHEVTGEDGGPVQIEYRLVKAKKQKRGGDGKGDGKGDKK